MLRQLLTSTPLQYLFPEILSKPQELGVGISGLRMQLLVHISACNAALMSCEDLIHLCRWNVFKVSTSLTKHLPSCLAWVITQFYKAITNLSIILNCQDLASNIVKGLCITQRDNYLAIGKDFQASHATNLVFIWNTEVFSAAVRAWKKGNDVSTCVPIFINVSWKS